MSIGPIESFPPPESSPSVHASADARLAETRFVPGGAQKPLSPVSGTLPNRENSLAKTAPVTYELPEDVVEVHQDPEDKGQIIIQYLDKAKNVVLQVPSNEELSVERGIAQELQEAAKLRQANNAAAVSEGEKNHGN